MKDLLLNEFIQEKQKASVLDTRPTALFKQGFVPESIHVPLQESFAEWATAVLNHQEPVIVIAEAGKETEAFERLTAAGFKNIIGYLTGGFETWKQAGNEMDMIIDIDPDELLMDIPFDDKMVILDVRKPVEFAEGHLKQAINLPLKELNDPVKIAQIEADDNIYLYCGGGTRSVIASTVLKKHGVHNLHNVAGGWRKIKEEPKAEIVKEPEMLN